MKIVAAILLSIAIARAATPSPKEQFEKFKHDNNRKYGCPEEEKLRFTIFNRASQMIEENNKEYKKGNSLWEIGLTNFSDLVGTEVARGYFPKGYKPKKPPTEEFAKFKTKYHRKYECPGLEHLRFHIFEVNFRKIQEHNAKNSSYKLGINQFTDMLSVEVPHGVNPPDQKQ